MSSSSTSTEEPNNKLPNQCSEIVCKNCFEVKTAELNEAKEKLEKLKTIMAKDMQARPKRGHIELRIENANEQFVQAGHIFSEPIELLGFKWKLCAEIDAQKKWLGLFLYIYKPANYTGPICVEVDTSYRILNQFRSKDVRKDLMHKFDKINGWGHDKLAEIEVLLNPGRGFISPDGSITADVDFTILSSTMEHILSQF